MGVNMSKKDNEFCYNDGMELKEFFNIRINDMEKANEIALAGIQKAVDIANQAMDRRLEGMNEFRQSLSDQALNFLTKSEYEQRHQNLEDKIDALAKLVYMGLGGILVIEFVFKFFVK